VCEVDEYVRRVLHPAKDGDTANMKAVVFAYTIQVSRMDCRVDQKATVALTFFVTYSAHEKGSLRLRDRSA